MYRYKKGRTNPTGIVETLGQLTYPLALWLGEILRADGVIE
jgi:hypothetical protein